MTPAPTNEELLQKVIEKQVKGGCRTHDAKIVNVNDYGYVRWKIESYWPGHHDISMRSHAHVLEILLDTEGCKSAYGGTVRTDVGTYTWKHITKIIVETWHSGPGNNVRAALETAVSFLPKT